MAFPHHTPQWLAVPKTFCYWSNPEILALPPLFLQSGRSHLKYVTRVTPAFLRKETAWVCHFCGRVGPHLICSPGGPAQLFWFCACYCCCTIHLLWLACSLSPWWWSWFCLQVDLVPQGGCWCFPRLAGSLLLEVITALPSHNFMPHADIMMMYDIISDVTDDLSAWLFWPQCSVHSLFSAHSVIPWWCRWWHHLSCWTLVL